MNTKHGCEDVLWGKNLRMGVHSCNNNHFSENSSDVGHYFLPNRPEKSQSTGCLGTPDLGSSECLYWCIHMYSHVSNPGFVECAQRAGAGGGRSVSGQGMCDAYSNQQTLQPVPTERDVFCFRIFRGAVGVVVLGLTGLFTILTAAPLFIEASAPEPPAPPPTPATPYTLWSEHDSHALRMILLISGAQASLLLVCWLVYRRRKSVLMGNATSRAASRQCEDAELRRLKQRRPSRRAKKLTDRDSGGGAARSENSRSEDLAEPLHT